MGKNSKPETVSFELNAVETARLRKFCEEHRRHAKHMSAGEMFRISFVPTLLGTDSDVQCLTCGAVESLTDFDEW